MSSSQWHTRKSLLLRASDQNDHEAFEEFTYYYKHFINMVLARMGVDQRYRNDINQELLLKLWRDLSKFDIDHERSNFRGWLSVVIRREVYRYLKKETKKSSQTDNLDDKDIGHDEFEKMIESEWKSYITTLAVEKVKTQSDGNAFAILEMTIEGKSVEAIAAALNIKENSVYVIRSRVKSRLQREIKTLREHLEFGEDA